MSQKQNNGREFTVDLWSDDDDLLDFGSDDDFDNMEQVHELSLAELLDRDEQRRQHREQREREEYEKERQEVERLEQAHRAREQRFTEFLGSLKDLPIRSAEEREATQREYDDQWAQLSEERRRACKEIIERENKRASDDYAQRQELRRRRDAINER